MSRLDPFLAGIIFSGSVYSLFQDALGVDRYVEYVRHTWVPSTITVPLASVGLALTVAFVVLLLVMPAASKGER